MTTPNPSKSDGTRDLALMLVEGGLITRQDLDEANAARAARGGRVVDILLALGIVSSRQVAGFLQEKFGYNRVDASALEIPSEILELVPQQFALEHDVVPLDVLGKTLTVAMAYPVDGATLAVLKEMTGLRPKPLLCSADDVRVCLARYYGGEGPANASIEGPLKLSSAVELLKGIDGLPALPGTVRRVREMVYEEDASAKEVGEVVSQDPAIAAKVLRLANSPAYGFPRQVDNVQLAVTLLGLEETNSVVLSTAVINLFDKSKVMDYVSFWLEAMVCGTFARALARAFDQRNYTGIVTAGILHDIGRIALAEVSPRLFRRIDRSLLGRALIDAEQAVIGLSHLEAGYHLAQHWNLPDELAEIIRFHPYPNHAREDIRPLAAIINIADVTARAHRIDAESRIPDLTECEGGMEILGVDEAAVMEVFHNVPRPSTKSIWSAN